MFGGDLPGNDPFTESLLINDEVLAANQKGSNQRKLFQQGDAVVWTSEVAGSRYYAAFNIGESANLEIRIPGTSRLRDVWERKPVEGRSVKLAPHASAMYSGN